MVIVNFSEENMYPDYYPEIWQYNYGQILRIQGLNLPPAVEVDFSLEEKGVDAIPYVGITKMELRKFPFQTACLRTMTLQWIIASMRISLFRTKPAGRRNTRLRYM